MTPVCKSCGKAIRASADGLCPACLILGALDPPIPVSAKFQPPPPAELQPFFDDFEILTLIGHGGMGAVYHARQLALDREVALKILPLEHFDSAEAEARFRQEARALARLDHPHIVSIHDFGERQDFFYIAMEYVAGTDLATLLQADLLPVQTALDFVSQICTALQFAHDQGIVHRDIKPANILVSKDQQIKIADFGLAKILGNSDSILLTARGEQLGTPIYVSPEQRRAALDADHRADIYSTGVLFYELLTGELPSGNFPLPSASREVDQQCDKIILKAMEQNPQRRFQHASEMGARVDSLQDTPTSRKKTLLILSLIILSGFIAFLFLKNPETSTVHYSEIIQPDNPRPGDWAGYHLFMRGDTALVGALQGDYQRRYGSGFVAVIQKNKDDRWTEVHRLTPPGKTSHGDQFGHVTASDEWIVVGSPRADHGTLKDTGKVYCYHAPSSTDPTTWQLTQTITIPNPRGREQAGGSIAIENDLLVISSYREDKNLGAAHLYQLVENRWQHRRKFTHPHASLLNRRARLFGIGGIALHRDILVISAKEPTKKDCGSVSIFERHAGGENNWGLTAHLTAPGKANAQRFGASVLFRSEDEIIVAASHQRNSDGSRGALYFIKRHEKTWRITSELFPPDSHASGFGRGVTATGDTLFVGAYATPASPDGIEASGIVYQFQRKEDRWELIDRIHPGVEGTAFGFRLHHSDKHLLISSRDYSTPFKNCGGVSIMKMPPTSN